jgi:hypothetical protein
MRAVNEGMELLGLGLTLCYNGSARGSEGHAGGLRTTGASFEKETRHMPVRGEGQEGEAAARRVHERRRCMRWKLVKTAHLGEVERTKIRRLTREGGVASGVRYRREFSVDIFLV